MVLPPLLEPPTDLLRNRVLTAGPDLLVAAVFLFTWISPYTFGDDTVQNLIFVVVFEFVILHSASVLVAVMLGGFGDVKGTGCLILISLFYLVFAIGFAFIIKAWWPVVAIVALTYNRIQTLRQHKQISRIHVIVTWGMTFGFYFFLMFAVHLIPWPPLGIDEALVESLLAQGSGSFFEEPQIALAFGLIYFGGVGLAEWLDWYTRATYRIQNMISG